MELKAIGELYDPSNKLLKEIFSDDAFPVGDNNFVGKLQKLGLKDESQVTSEEFLQVAELLNASHDHPASIRRAQSLWTLLTSQISRLDSRALHALSQFRCLPALHAKSMPDSYPCDLPAACPEAVLVSPRDVYPYQYLALVGSVAPVADEQLSTYEVMQPLFKQELDVETVLQHLANIIRYYNTRNSLKYRTQLNVIYSYFNSNVDNEELVKALKETPCLLVESEAIFLKPSCFWIEDNTDDIVLRPYRYRMSQEIIIWQNLFVACGARVCQDSRILLEVLSEIQKDHLQTASKKQTKRDLNLVLQILESLKDYPPEYRREVILPVAHCEQSGLRFRPAVKCTVGDATWLMEAEFEVENDDEVSFVHPNVPVSTALALGALGMMDRALDETEEIDYDYYQDEPLTTRLHNLLEDSYTDGFSIPKELIQNADDAGARQVKFLLDERQNEDCREHLLHPNMASLQGPALWVFNDATFSDQDFANIIKLGAGTKKDDASKVGKFGLGFNAVYNLTDVPSFVSRNIVAFFDPHRKQLPRKSLGMKIDLGLTKNQRLLKTVPSQFRPFEGVFGCSLQRENFYAGTLFRLPFRSEEQAVLSDIKKDSYFPEKRRQFIAMLIERAGNLLLFTQSVQNVEVFYLSQDAKSPNSMACLMSVTRKEQLAQHSPHRGLQDHTEGILKYCTQSFEEFFQRRSDAPDIRITENVTICVEVSPEAKTTCSVDSCRSHTEWRITWASGTNQSAMLALANKDQGLVPLAAAAVPLHGTNLLKIDNCPFGFYQEGRLFCFLPLPEQIEQPLLPVHLNGTFALTSSRRNLLISTEENIDNKGGEWNSALVSDAVCRAYLLLLESLQDTVDDDHTSYYELWPTSENGLSLVSNFYTCLVNEQFQVFPSQTGWVSFEKARFFSDSFRHCPVGDLAFEVVLDFWDGQTSFVDIPHQICKTFLKTAPQNAFIDKFLSEDEFYESVFFPNINSNFWKTPEKTKIRDSLTLHAIVKGNDRVKKLVSTYACIPCQASPELKTPNQLVHPYCEIAALFLPADGRFPQTGSDKVSFCQLDCLQTLTSLGMATDELQWKDIIERANSVKDLLALNKDKAFEKAHTLIDYLASTGPSSNKTRMSLCPTDVIQELSVTEFLPVLTKPDDWPFLWFDDDLEPRLAAPCQLYHRKMINLVSCTQKILASSTAFTVRFKTSELSRQEVLESLKVVTLDQPICDPSVDAVLKQLLYVSNHYESHSQIFSVSGKTGKICHDIYFFLQRCIKSDQAEKYKRLITDKLKSERIIWTGSHFCHPSVLAFTMKLSCPPYLQEVSAHDKAYFKDLFQFLGVKEKFGTQDLLSVIDKMKQDVGSRQLSDKEVELFCRAAQLFCSARQETPEVGPLDPKLVFLPDKEGFLKCVDNLCLDDTSRLKPRIGMHFIHETFSSEVAKALGVKTKNSTILQKHMRVKSFGQSEKLTNRIKRLLQGYTCDVSIFKEFIQNADDAGATEIRFIKDFRQLGTDSVPDGWKELQGPALCVYNNADFTSKDIEGIQNLGEGSKGEEMMKTGQFGVGFNAVYHITDVPSFWTRRDGTEQVICVCDPCRIIPNDFHDPGMELEDIDSLKEEYPDMVDGYLGNTFDMSQPGTLFRLPLRTKWMTARSSINNEQMTQHNVSKILVDFIKEASMCLLFLNNLTKIGIYFTRDGRTLEKEYEVEMVIDEGNAFKKEAFYRFLKEEGEKMIDDDLNFNIRHILFPDTVLSFSLKDSQGVQEDWIEVNRAGFLDADHVSEKLQEDWRKERFRLLPRGGVAVKVKRTEQPISGLSLLQNTVRSLIFQPEKLCSRVFCSLPLPVETDLPVHVNGHFALEHESRRNLLDRQNDSKTEWNRLICTKVIAPAYIKALEQVKFAWFGKQRKNEAACTNTAKLYEFYFLFPRIPITESTFWSPLVEAFYQQMISGCHALLPVTKAGSNSLGWTCVWKENGFAGYFTRPPGCASAPPLQSFPPQPLGEETVSDKNLSELLKRLNMKIVDVPDHVYTALKDYGADKFQEATPRAVLLFLKSCTSKTSDSCTLKNLPQPLTDLELNENDVFHLLEFVKKVPSFSSEIVGLPLCLLQSGTLHVFSLQQQPFVTEYHDLLPMLSEEFLHGSLVNIFKSFLNNDFHILKRFDIQDLAERLSHCLDPKQFKTGLPCSLNKVSLPHETWLKLLWEFLQNRLKHIDQDSQLSEALKCLNEWSLIPCKLARQGECFLYPVQDRGNLLFLPYPWLISSGQTLEDKVMNILQKLSVPILDDFIVFQKSLAERLVGSVCKFESIMHILRSFKGIISFCQSDAFRMLQYFAPHLKQLKQKVNCNYLREIPMFCTIGDRTTSIGSKTVLLLPKKIPQDGLDRWSLATETSLLDADFIPSEVCQFLGLDKSSNLHMIFWRRLLSTVSQLPQEAIAPHIAFMQQSYSHYLKRNEVDDLFDILSHTPFIRNNADRMCRPSEFYSPLNSVFLQMCDGNKFPPPPYCEIQWCDFMEKAGMVKDVTLEMFVSFAKQVEAEGKSGLSEKTLKRSSTLVKCLLGEGRLRYSGLLNDVCKIRFVRPWSFEVENENKRLAKICPPFVTNRLVSFSESCHSCHWPLFWSQTSIVHPHEDPDMFMSGSELQTALKQLMFEDEVPMGYFKQHVARVCHVLSSTECDLLHSSDGRKEVEWLFDRIYLFLTKINQSELNVFKTMPVIFDNYNCRVLYPEQVVINLSSSNDAVDGWLFRAPKNYDKFFRLFQCLGVADSLTADHYARVLTKLNEAYPDQSLEGDMLTACKNAVQGLFRCLRWSCQMNEMVLYLPNEQFCLKPSTSLIVNDDENLKKRLKSCSGRFVADCKQLGIESPQARDMSSLLPERYRMLMLSRASVEVIPYSSVKMGFRENKFKKKLTSVEFSNGVTRLVNHKHVTKGIAMKPNTRQKIRDIVKSIQVVEIEGLHTVLVIDKEEVAGSESYHRIRLDDRYPQQVFVDRRASVSDEDVAVTLADVLIKVLDEDLSKFRPLLIAMLRCPDIQDLLDQRKITYFRESDTCKPGSYVNVDDVCLLNNNVASIFMEDEDSAMEVSDPLIDTDETTRSFTDLPTQTHQVFIYVRVIKRLGVEGCNDGHPCCVSYRIDIGCGQKMDVSAVRLYKIPTTYDTEDTSDFMPVSANQAEHSDPRTDDVVVNEAKNCLQVALPLLKDRLLQLGLLKRLCLQWHPNLSTINVYSQVLELIKRITLSVTKQPISSTAFFDRVFERGQLYASQVLASRRENDFNHQRKRKNPQPGEGQRWLRQAFVDLRTASITPEGNNWHCLMCHLAAEKALKAVLFHNDADHKLLHPEEKTELTTLAKAVGSKRLIRVVEMLVGITGERWRMSYPFVQWAPQIPALLYDDDTARSACSQAETILTIAASLMK